MPDLFGMRISSPREMFDGAVRTAQSAGSEAARLGSAAVSRANELGRTIDTTIHDVGASVDRRIAETQSWAQTGIRDGVAWTGQRVQAGADVARAAVGDDTILGRAATTAINAVERQSRFNVGVTGGVANEAVGLLGTAATLGSTATQMQLSPTRNAEVRDAVLGAVASGAEAAFQYGQSVAANPGRLSSDAEALRQGAVDLGDRVANHYQTAIAEGRGPEAFGITAGQVLANVIPIGASANVARAGVTGALSLTARDGAEVVAREGAEAVVREGAEALAHEAEVSGVWKLDPFQRGREIEQALGQNLPGNFPVIDKFENGLATSIKSLDLAASTYQNNFTMTRMLNGYIDKVASFEGRTWAGVRIRSQDISGRALEVAIPHSGSVAQQAIIGQTVEYGTSRGVAVNVTIFL